MSHRRSIRACDSSRTPWVEVAPAERKMLVTTFRIDSVESGFDPVFRSAGCVFPTSPEIFNRCHCQQRGVGAAARARHCQLHRAAPTRARESRSTRQRCPQAPRRPSAGWRRPASVPAPIIHRGPRFRQLETFRRSPRLVPAQRRGLARFRRRLPLPRLRRPIPRHRHRGSSPARPRRPSRRDAAGVERSLRASRTPRKSSRSRHDAFSSRISLPSPR